MPDLALMGLMISLFLGNLLLSLPGLVGLSIFSIAATALIFWMVPEHVPNIEFVLVIVIFNTVAAILVVVSRWLHHQIEQDRLLTLQKSEERFRQLAENIQEVFWIAGPGEANIQYISPTFEQVWGRPVSFIYENPDGFLQSIHPEDREELVKPMLAQQDLGERTATEYRIVRPDGAIRRIWDRSFPLKDESGQVYRVIGIAEDITERKQMERELRDNEELLFAVADNFPRAFVSVINSDLVVGFASGQEFKRSQLDPQDYIGRRVPDLFEHYGEEVLEMVLKAYRQALAGQDQFFELFIDEQHLAYAAVPLPNERGEIHQILVVTQNITERKQAEEELRESQRRLHEAQKHGRIGSWELDLVKNQFHVSEVFRDFHGMGKHTYDFEMLKDLMVHPDDAAYVNQAVDKAIAGQLYEITHRIYREDNREVRGVHARGSLVRDESGKPLRLVGSSQDILNLRRQKRPFSSIAITWKSWSTSAPPNCARWST